MKTAMIFPSAASDPAIAGYSITLCESIEKTGLKVDQIEYKAKSFRSFSKILPKLKKYDTVHLQHEYNLLGGMGAPFFPALVLLRLFTRGKLILTMHTVLSKKENYLSKNFLLNWARRNLFYPLKNRLINMVSDKIVVHAHFFKDILVKEYGFNKEKVEVIPQGILENIPLIEKSKAKKELGLSGPVYLVIGSFVPAHGADIIIKQAKKIGKTILVVINPKKAKPEYMNEMMDYAKNNSLSEVRFELKDIKSDMSKDWWIYFSASDLVLLPYRGGIGSGILAHAIAAGRPMVASNIQYFTEIGKKFKGIAIARTDNDFPNVIKRVMKKSSLKKMENACQRYKNEFSLTSIGKKYNRIYNSLA